ncbi:MAG: PRC-barrel domain-containing protein, partial [Sphingomonas sp.]
QRVGTEALGGGARRGVGPARGLASQVRDTGSAVVAGARGAAGQAVASAGSVAGNGAATASLGGGQLALAGTAAASGNGSFDVTRGMSVADTRGRVIGTVQEVRTTASGAIEAVTVAVGNRLSQLPAANFSGSGDVLVSQMGKAEISRAAKQQPAQ